MNRKENEDRESSAARDRFRLRSYIDFREPMTGRWVRVAVEEDGAGDAVEEAVDWAE